MSNVRFIADLHLGHAWLSEERGFSSIQEHNLYIVDQWNSIVNKKDLTFVLGDVSMSAKKSIYDAHLLSKMNGRKVLIGGNHDSRQNFAHLCKYFESIIGCMQYHKYILTHIPIHPSELYERFKGNIHGHTHENHIMKTEWSPIHGKEITIKDKRYINVCCENIDYKPKTLEELTLT